MSKRKNGGVDFSLSAMAAGMTGGEQVAKQALNDLAAMVTNGLISEEEAAELRGEAEQTGGELVDSVSEAIAETIADCVSDIEVAAANGMLPDEAEQAKVEVITLGIGQVARRLILSKPDATNKVVLERVKSLFPDAKTTAACIAWYRNDLIKKGLLQSGAKRNVLKVRISAADLVL